MKTIIIYTIVAFITSKTSRGLKMINQSRRSLMKGMGYGLALSVAGVSTAAMALSGKGIQADTTVNALPSCDITIYQQTSSNKEIVSLMNFTGKPVTLDSIKPVGLEHVNGSLVVKLNNVVTDSAIIIAAGERLSFEIEATSNHPLQDGVFIPNVLAGHVEINSDHPAFNGIIPVTVFDGQTA